MSGAELIEKYFGDRLTATQAAAFAKMGELYAGWNGKINVVSRQDMDNLYERHILHSLAIAKVVGFKAGESVMDAGCGGGFPGVPLAVMFPETKFYMVDSIAKKIKVVGEVSAALGLKNVVALNARAESLDVKVDYVVSRAVTRLKIFMEWTWGKINGGEGHGLLYLKGGDLEEELAEGTKGVKGMAGIEEYAISGFFGEEFFETKKIIYIKKTGK